MNLFIKIYLFNITNSEDYLSGRDEKMMVQEVGPYVYRWVNIDFEKLLVEGIAFQRRLINDILSRRTKEISFKNAIALANEQLQLCNRHFSNKTRPLPQPPSSQWADKQLKRILIFNFFFINLRAKKCFLAWMHSRWNERNIDNTVLFCLESSNFMRVEFLIFYNRAKQSQLQRLVFPLNGIPTERWYWLESALSPTDLLQVASDLLYFRQIHLNFFSRFFQGIIETWRGCIQWKWNTFFGAETSIGLGRGTIDGEQGRGSFHGAEYRIAGEFHFNLSLRYEMNHLNEGRQAI